MHSFQPLNAVKFKFVYFLSNFLWKGIVSRDWLRLGAGAFRKPVWMQKIKKLFFTFQISSHESVVTLLQIVQVPTLSCSVIYTFFNSVKITAESHLIIILFLQRDVLSPIRSKMNLKTCSLSLIYEFDASSVRSWHLPFRFDCLLFADKRFIFTPI